MSAGIGIGIDTRHAVWTDFGGVLTQPVAHTFRDFEMRTGVPTHALRSAMVAVGRDFGTDAMGPLDIPLVDEPTWSALVEDELLCTYGVDADLSDFGERWFAGRPANTEWVQCLRRLREAGVFVGLLSNMPPAWDPLWRRMIAAEEFDAVVLSSRVGARKPEPEIFAVACASSGRAPEDSILVDDLAKNCDGARAVGWQALAFADAATATADLERLLRRAAETPVAV